MHGLRLVWPPYSRIWRHGWASSLNWLDRLALVENLKGERKGKKGPSLTRSARANRSQVKEKWTGGVGQPPVRRILTVWPVYFWYSEHGFNWTVPSDFWEILLWGFLSILKIVFILWVFVVCKIIEMVGALCYFILVFLELWICLLQAILTMNSCQHLVLRHYLDSKFKKWF